MSTFSEDLNELFQRDLNRLLKEVDETPEDLLWSAPEGVNNSCGELVQHLLGNLNHFIGAALGDTGYQRDMESEFRTKTLDKSQMLTGLQELKSMIREVMDKLDEDLLGDSYPANLPFDATVQKFLLHLYGHLGYHRGQYNYLRRIVDENNN